jgi:hypothetical protein
MVLDRKLNEPRDKKRIRGSFNHDDHLPLNNFGWIAWPGWSGMRSSAIKRKSTSQGWRCVPLSISGQVIYSLLLHALSAMF